MSDQQMRHWILSAVDEMGVAMRESTYHNAGFGDDAKFSQADLGYYVALHDSRRELYATSYQRPLAAGVEELLDNRATGLARKRETRAPDQWLESYAQQHSAVTEQLSNAHQALMAGQTPVAFSVHTHDRDNQPSLAAQHEVAHHIEAAGYQQLPERMTYSEHPDHELHSHQREHGGPASPGHHHGLHR